MCGPHPQLGRAQAAGLTGPGRGQPAWLVPAFVRPTVGSRSSCWPGGTGAWPARLARAGLCAAHSWVALKLLAWRDRGVASPPGSCPAFVQPTVGSRSNCWPDRTGAWPARLARARPLCSPQLGRAQAAGLTGPGRGQPAWLVPGICAAHSWVALKLLAWRDRGVASPPGSCPAFDRGVASPPGSCPAFVRPTVGSRSSNWPGGTGAWPARLARVRPLCGPQLGHAQAAGLTGPGRGQPAWLVPGLCAAHSRVALKLLAWRDRGVASPPGSCPAFVRPTVGSRSSCWPGGTGAWPARLARARPLCGPQSGRAQAAGLAGPGRGQPAWLVPGLCAAHSRVALKLLAWRDRGVASPPGSCPAFVRPTVGSRSSCWPGGTGAWPARLARARPLCGPQSGRAQAAGLAGPGRGQPAWLVPGLCAAHSWVALKLLAWRDRGVACPPGSCRPLCGPQSGRAQAAGLAGPGRGQPAWLVPGLCAAHSQVALKLLAWQDRGVASPPGSCRPLSGPQSVALKLLAWRDRGEASPPGSSPPFVRPTVGSRLSCWPGRTGAWPARLACAGLCAAHSRVALKLLAWRDRGVASPPGSCRPLCGPQLRRAQAAGLAGPGRSQPAWLVPAHCAAHSRVALKLLAWQDRGVASPPRSCRPLCGPQSGRAQAAGLAGPGRCQPASLVPAFVRTTVGSRSSCWPGRTGVWPARLAFARPLCGPLSGRAQAAGLAGPGCGQPAWLVPALCAAYSRVALKLLAWRDRCVASPPGSSPPIVRPTVGSRSSCWPGGTGAWPARLARARPLCGPQLGRAQAAGLAGPGRGQPAWLVPVLCAAHSRVALKLLAWRDRGVASPPGSCPAFVRPTVGSRSSCWPGGTGAWPARLARARPLCGPQSGRAQAAGLAGPGRGQPAWLVPGLCAAHSWVALKLLAWRDRGVASPPGSCPAFANDSFVSDRQASVASRDWWSVVASPGREPDCHPRPQTDSDKQPSLVVGRGAPVDACRRSQTLEGA
ncbi:uncharacterized protein LOC134536302 [Bacillus rossius redtenbacheri]|uniref:uncharacterized protein LOC134536302 n=1 Tax=Bacillus rossius redtenbacheri TaxID=93214 RepID=UPI002FDD3956